MSFEPSISSKTTSFGGSTFLGYISSCACEDKDRDYHSKISITKCGNYFVVRNSDDKEIYPDTVLERHYYHNPVYDDNKW